MSTKTSDNKRIAKNILLLCFRMLFMMVVSLYRAVSYRMRWEWMTLEYISVNRKHNFKFVALCKHNAIHIKQ